ncbi:amino acid ABC transporter permease [Enterococcus florum]|uniref:Amino acid ABC transporter permease n=1 Tax=Enterococcus florum TaxID=2480627 RepID=A0A4P5PE49_9ENTE|nr:ABC transporter permease [Enterococcus florum]GCF94874.1 amino acid ABC transporter permease [Enterococcus florum]
MTEFFVQFGQYITQNASYLLEQIQTHLSTSLISVLLCILIGFPIGTLLDLYPKAVDYVIGVVNIIQTVPSMAMLIIVLILFGLGTKTVILTVIMYSILPIIKNTYVGLSTVEPIYIDSAKGLGMDKWQILFMVKIPLALPVILAGVKNALVLAVGTTTIGSFVGAGGLGDVILRGINTVGGTSILVTGALLCTLIVWLFELLIDLASRLAQAND